MPNLTSPKLMYLKFILFLLIGLITSTLLLLESPTLRTAALLALAIWAFARAYYFIFYVIQNYIDPTYKFAGLYHFLRYLFRPRK